MPDGSMAKIKLRKNAGDKEKVEYNAAPGTPLDAGTAYKLRTLWKQMTEDFVASITGNASIHIPSDFNDGVIQNELNIIKFVDITTNFFIL